MKSVKICIWTVLIMIIMTATVFGAGKYINMTLKYDGVTHNYSAEEVKLIVNGNELKDLTMPPIILNSYTLVPAREVFEELGAVVDWKSDLQQVYITYQDTLVLISIDSTKAYVNGESGTMDIPAKIINDKTMIPVRFVSEAIGMNVEWKSDTRTIVIGALTESTTEETTTATTVKPVTVTQATTVVVSNSDSISQSGNVGTLIPLSSASYPQTDINSVTMSGNGMYVINASGEISDVSTMELEGGRVVVDISNAKNCVPMESYTLAGQKVSSIRVGQFTSSPMVTRVVFVVPDKDKYSISMTSDRKAVVLSFEQANISGISLSKSGSSDIINIVGNVAPNAGVSLSGDGKLLTIDMNNAVLTGEQGTIGSGNYVTGGSYYAQSSSNVRVSLNLNEVVSYKVSQSGTTTTVTLTESPFKNMTYSSTNHQLAIKKNGADVNINSIAHNDNYMGLVYTMTFDGDYSSVFGSGDMPIDDEYLKNINFSTNGGKSVITFNEKRILAYNVTTDNDYIYITAVLPKEKYDKILVLDPGHGGSAPGTSGNGLVEKDLTLDMCNRIIKLFEADGRVKVYATRTTDVNPSFDARTDLSNEVGDIFVSVHINSAYPNTTANGTETYHQYPNTQENGLTSYILATKMLNKLLAELGTNNRKVKSDNLIVLRQNKMPATLVEIGFISNSSDAALMGSEEGKNKVAKAIYEGVLEIFEEYPTGR